jgi:predicted nucleic acid-binding protein
VIAESRKRRPIGIARLVARFNVPDRIWQLRANLTAYVALAEGLGAPLITRDAALARAPGHRARIEVLALFVAVTK